MLFQEISPPLLSTLLLITNELSNSMSTSGISTRNNIDNYTPPTAHTMERRLSIIRSPINTATPHNTPLPPPPESRAPTPPSSSTSASKILNAHPITITQTFFLTNTPNATPGLTTAYTALTTTAHQNRTAAPGPKTFTITTDSISVVLASDTAIAWECVSVIGHKLTALAKAGLLASFGAGFYCPDGLRGAMVAVGIGISLAAITKAWLFAKRPYLRGGAGAAVGLPPAEVLAEDMLRYGSLRFLCCCGDFTEACVYAGFMAWLHRLSDSGWICFQRSRALAWLD